MAKLLLSKCGPSPLLLLRRLVTDPLSTVAEAGAPGFADDEDSPEPFFSSVFARCAPKAKTIKRELDLSVATLPPGTQPNLAGRSCAGEFSYHATAPPCTRSPRSAFGACLRACASHAQAQRTTPSGGAATWRRRCWHACSRWRLQPGT